MYSVTKTFKFAAAHAIHTLGFDHKCSRIHGHGYRMEVTFSNSELDKHGFVVDAGGELVQAIKDEIDERWDHNNLNAITNAPTAENLCRIWFDWIVERCELVSRVRIYESDTIWAEYKY